MTKSKLLHTLILLLPLTVFATEQNDEAQSISQDNEMSAMATQHNNKVCAFGRWLPEQFHISTDENNYDYKITKGQPWGGISNTLNDGCITIKAGRSKSTDVVNWVKSASNVSWSEKNMGTNVSGSDPKPGRLNFAAKINLNIKFDNKAYLCDNVIIAQGSTSFDNNWWFVSNFENQTNTDSVKVKCTLEGRDAYIYFLKYNRQKISTDSSDWKLRFSETPI